MSERRLRLAGRDKLKKKYLKMFSSLALCAIASLKHSELRINVNGT